MGKGTKHFTTLIETWENDRYRYVILGDAETQGRAFAELTVIPKTPGDVVEIPADLRDRVVEIVTQMVARGE